MAFFTLPYSSGSVIVPHYRLGAVGNAVTGILMTSRTEFTTVITPTYKSPPNFCRLALYIICTRQLVIDMVKPVMPRATMSFTLEALRRKQLAFNLKILLGLVRKRRIHSAESPWEITVANAAPLLPYETEK